MGDRANIVFNTEPRHATARLEDFLPGSIVLYSHWGGYSLGRSLATALRQAKSGWDDEGYGIRIIVSQMVGKNWDQETGYGLYVGLIADNDNPIIVCDFSSQNVIIFGNERAEYSFKEFASFDDESAHVAYRGKEEDDDE